MPSTYPPTSRRCVVESIPVVYMNAGFLPLIQVSPCNNRSTASTASLYNEGAHRGSARPYANWMLQRQAGLSCTDQPNDQQQHDSNGESLVIQPWYLCICEYFEKSIYFICTTNVGP